MFRFFFTKKWLLWSIFGTLFIIGATWYQVQLDVKINEWFGTFYDVLQKALAEPGTVTLDEFTSLLFTFGGIAGLWVIIATVVNFFTSHWIFRWRTSMAEYYHEHYDFARDVEGASQRVQEDTLRFARGIEGLGVGLLDAIMTLVAFTPILWVLSEQISEILWFGAIPHSLVWVAIITALGGTVILALVGIKLPGIEYHIQRKEAAYRKELVLGEDDWSKAPPPVLADLFAQVRAIHFKSYFNYGYFNLVRWSYFQGMVIVPYLVLAPTIIAGKVTLGFIQQISRAFGRVSSSLQFLAQSWPTVVELISVYKRLREFEKTVKAGVEKQ